MSSTTISQITGFFDRNSWHYDIDHDGSGNEFLRAGFTIKSKLKSISVQIRTLKIGIKIVGICRLSVDEEYRASVAEYLHRANYGLNSGNFELDVRDGEVRYKVYLPEYDGYAVPDEAIDSGLDVIIDMFTRYGDGLAALMMGFSDPETEIKKAEGDL